MWILFLLLNLSFSQQAVKKGDTIFVGQYLFTGSETTSVWLEVRAFNFCTQLDLVCQYVYALKFYFKYDQAILPCLCPAPLETSPWKQELVHLDVNLH